MKSQPTADSPDDENHNGVAGEDGERRQVASVPITLKAIPRQSVSSSEKDRSTEGQPAALNPGPIPPPFHSEDYPNLQFYGNYSSYRDFYSSWRESASYDDLNSSTPDPGVSNLFDAASNWFGACFGCNPGDESLQNREESAGTEISDGLLDNETAARQGKAKESHPENIT